MAVGGKERMARTIRLDGERISLAGIEPDEWRAVERGLAPLDPIARPRAVRDSEALRRRLERSGRFWRGRLDLAIRTRDGRMVGLVAARRRPVDRLPKGVVSIGVVVFDTADRGKGYATEALLMLTSWLLESGVERVQAETSARNAPMRAVLERLGFELEGVLRAFAVGEHGREDIAIYAVVP
jgi:RimJ/RimL family protein N-acetyltransferase